MNPPLLARHQAVETAQRSLLGDARLARDYLLVSLVHGHEDVQGALGPRSQNNMRLDFSRNEGSWQVNILTYFGRFLLGLSHGDFGRLPGALVAIVQLERYGRQSFVFVLRDDRLGGGRVVAHKVNVGNDGRRVAAELLDGQVGRVDGRFSRHRLGDQRRAGDV